MGFKGSFSKQRCNRLGGGFIWSFELTNTDWFGSKKYSIVIYDTFRQNPWYWRNQVLKAKHTVSFNFDTVDWEFYQGDTVCLIDDNDRILQSWTLQLREYRPGECPECHGTHKCRHCNGEGYVYPRGRVEEFKKCEVCDGTGMCQTCFVPTRTPHMGGMPTGLTPFKAH